MRDSGAVGRTPLHPFAAERATSPDAATPPGYHPDAPAEHRLP